MRRLLLLLALVCLPAVATAEDNPIAARMDALTAAYNAHDAATIIAEFYTEDAVLLPPHSKVLTGRQEIAAHYANAFKAGVANLRYKILEVHQYGPAILEIGETLLDVSGQTIRGRYMHVWVNQDGKWRLSRDMYNVVGAE